MARSTTSSSPSATPSFPSPDLAACYADIHKSYERFCLTAGIDALAQMLDEDVTDLAGERSGHNADKPGYRWGTTMGSRLRSSSCLNAEILSLVIRSSSSKPGTLDITKCRAMLLSCGPSDSARISRTTCVRPRKFCSFGKNRMITESGSCRVHIPLESMWPRRIYLPCPTHIRTL